MVAGEIFPGKISTKFYFISFILPGNTEDVGDSRGDEDEERDHQEDGLTLGTPPRPLGGSTFQMQSNL